MLSTVSTHTSSPHTTSHLPHLTPLHACPCGQPASNPCVHSSAYFHSRPCKPTRTLLPSPAICRMHLQTLPLCAHPCFRHAFIHTNRACVHTTTSKQYTCHPSQHRIAPYHHRDDVRDACAQFTCDHRQDPLVTQPLGQ